MSEPPALSNPAIKPDLALKTPGRSPALSILVCFSIGILFDYYFQPELFHWLVLSITLTILWAVTFRYFWNFTATLLLLLLVFSLGGMRHHEFWYCHAPDHITRFLKGQDQSSQLIHITGVIQSKPQVQITPIEELFDPNQPTQRTSFILDCNQVTHRTNKVPVSGKIRVTVRDPKTESGTNPNTTFSIGDTIELSGELRELSPQDNPHDFDFKTHYRKQHIDATMSVKSSLAINLVSRSDDFALISFRQKLQNHMTQLIVDNTSTRTQSLGLALLLGDRSELTTETRKMFSQSGLIHFLAISGFHIGFFTVFVWSLCHFLNTPRPVAVSILILAILFYLSIIEIRPPILRAATFCILVTLGLINWRTITTLNLMCITAIVILLINPTDLFDVGTQLSFLAVSSILWTVQQDFYQNPFQQNWIPLRWRIVASNPVLQSPLQWLLIRYFRLIYGVFLVTFFIWIVTAPLVIYHFKLVAPLGILINTLIFPFLFLILLLGYLLMFVGSMIPFTAAFFGFCFDYSLRFLLWIVETVSSIPFAHFDLFGPPAWWLLGYYTLILAAIIPFQCKTRLSWNWFLHKIRLAIIPLWIIVGLWVPLSAAQTSSLRCTFIAVNHGISILIETPKGQSILYDAGSMASVDSTYTKIKNTLLSRGIGQVDLLLISHADRDHFNAASDLISNHYVGQLAFPQPFLDRKQQGTIHLCDTANQFHVPIQIVEKGDYLDLGPELSLEVLHPDASDKYETDNPASLTVLLSYQGRRILLTGDLEGKGLEKLLSDVEMEPVDVLLAPHHGSLSANTVKLDRWANPDYVIISGGKEDTNSKLKSVYSSGTQIYSTRLHGAITCLVDDKGNLQVTAFRGQN